MFDLVVVGAPEIDAFTAQGKIVAGTRVDLVKSGVAVAVKEGALRPDIGSAEALKKALLAARAVGYSTGSSGVYTQNLFAKLGIAEEMKPKSKQTQPGFRVANWL